MALGGMGSLTLMLRANTATFASDLGKAVTMANASMNQISRTLGKASDAFKMLAGGIGLYQIASFGLGIIKATASLEGLSMTTGLSVGALSALSVEAQRSGMTVDDAAMAFDRMQRSAGAALSGNRQMEAHFKSIGISAQQLADGLKNPEQMYIQVARAMEQFKDDGNKTITMMALFGKAGADQIELLHRLAIDGYSSANVTAEQAAQAKNFEVALANLSIRTKALAVTFLSELVPALSIVNSTWENRFEEMGIRLAANWKITVLQIKSDLADFDSVVAKAGDALRDLFGIKPQDQNIKDFVASVKSGIDSINGSLATFDAAANKAGDSLAKLFNAKLPDFWTKPKALDDFGKGAVSVLNTLDAKVAASGIAVKQFFTLPSNEFDDQVKVIRDAATAKIAANDVVLANDKKVYAERHALDELFVTRKYMADTSPKKTITPPALDNQKVLKMVDDLKKQFDSRIKILDNQIKLEDGANKTLNKQLDQDYATGLLSLADYSVKKDKALSESFNKTQAIYDLEIANARAYADAENKIYQDANRLANKQEGAAARMSDPAMAQAKANQESVAAQTRARANAALSNSTIALGVVQGKLDEQVLARQKHEQEGIALTEKLAGAGLTYAGIVSDINIQYATLIGDTALANELQMEQADALRKTALNANLNAEALTKLAAIQEDQRLRSSQKGLAGMQRAVIDYARGLMEVAKATEAMTTRMLTGMEDALVSFVQTGKLDWRSLIDSMIADLIRMQIRASIMPAISGWLKLGLTALGAGAGAGAGVDTNAEGTAGFVGPPQGKASGGSVSRGVSYQVGERGAERFVPSVAGTIIPNGVGGGMQVTYAPIIQIDSRSDRAQVAQDTADIVRRGQKELVLLLQRYNPGLKV